MHTKRFLTREVSYASLTGGEGFLGVSPSKLGKKTLLTAIVLCFVDSRENLEGGELTGLLQRRSSPSSLK